MSSAPQTPPASPEANALPEPGEAPLAVALVLATERDAPSARRLAEALLERNLVGCVSWSPVTSLYRWQSSLELGEEVQLLLKTSPRQLPALARALDELHSYETPEWIHWIGSSGGAYGQWLMEGLRSRGADAPAPAGDAGSGGPAG
ncbi:divalent-cation tolerance protein CutA [Synechococcus sp. RSCCF101]|uniref:divalent-cation tolerance protein CutA n=1 Tax=Synechococcus sp. RSCCF101 TaxID=2511069 RepID=UPI001244F5E2|nr:divalent-cation tolerance protein CutA [Synechococcus sp. RSCCF101]QEY31390.1 divalent-cation tolerance protein CutA [Synechococcus sp. RSCCF101]